MSLTQDILLIDVGNTNIKWAWMSLPDRVLEIHSTSHRDISVEELGAGFQQRGAAPSRVLIANVAGKELERGLSGWINTSWGLHSEIIVPQAKAFGVILAYRQPQQLGVDRWLTLIAAHRVNGCPACVVDSGTALTVDVVDSTGRHLGGLILPGSDLMRKALLSGTRIPTAEPPVTIDLLGEDTASCIASASLHATGALVDRVVVHTRSMIGVTPKLIFTGSGAPLLMSAVEHPASWFQTW